MSGQSVCVVGAGIMGITTAHYLMKSGRCSMIYLLEEGQVAGGASGKAAGFLARDWHSEPTASLGKLSYSLHSQLAEELDGENRYGYRKVSSLSMNVKLGKGKEHGSEEQLRDPLKTWLDLKNVSDINLIDDETGTAQLHPEMFCHTLLDECLKGGVQLIHGRAISVDSSDDGKDSHLIHYGNAGESIQAERLVLCTGPWSGKVVKELFNIDIPIYELAGHSVVLRTSKPLPPLAIFASVKDIHKSSTTTPELFSRPDGTIYIAGENSGAPLPPGTAQVKTMQPSIDRLLSACKLISPLLDVNKDARIEKMNLCYRPVTDRGYPYLCKLPQRSNLYLVAGHGPWGISLSTGSGKAMSEMVLNGKVTCADVQHLERM